MLPIDNDVVKQVQGGDSDAFGELIQRYEPKLSRYLSRFLRDEEKITDVLQDTFIKAYVNIQSFDPDYSFSSWIYRIAHNEAVNTLKKKKATPFSWFEPDVLFPHFSVDDTTIHEIDQQTLKSNLDTILEKLLPTQREILILSFYEELSYKEIALILKIPVSSVGVRIMRAKKRALAIIKEDYSHLYDSN